GTLVQRRHPGIIVHQVVLALAHMEQVGSAGRVLPLDAKGQPGARHFFAVVGFRTQLSETVHSLLVAVVKLNGRIGLAPGCTGPGGKVGDDIALPFAAFFVCHRPSLWEKKSGKLRIELPAKIDFQSSIRFVTSKIPTILLQFLQKNALGTLVWPNRMLVLPIVRSPV